MIVAEGRPEDIFVAFQEDSSFEEAALCILLSNRKNDAVALAEVVRRVLEIDSLIADRIAFVVLGEGIGKGAYTDGPNQTSKVFPGIVP